MPNVRGLLRWLAVTGLLWLAGAVTPALAAGGGSGLGRAAPGGAAAATLLRSLNAGMHAAGAYSGAEVVDLSSGQTLYAHAAGVPRLPASVEKLYTTATALARFGAGGRLTTSLLGAGHRQGNAWVGALYLRGGGDPTFGSAGFDHAHYATGATVQALVAGLRSAGISALRGPVITDASWFDTDAGTSATGGRLSTELEGGLSALAFNRDWGDADGDALFSDPAHEAGEQLVAALRAAGIRVAAREPVRGGVTPPDATPLASVASPAMATLLALTNAPSDNFFAEMLLKDLGARFGGAGTTAAGAAVVRGQLRSAFGIQPRLVDGSGLSRADRTTPAQVISLLTQMQDTAAFTGSLAIMGLTGTLVDENHGTYAQGRCIGKTGTLHDVSNLVGYCRARDGHTLAYAFLMNGVIPDAAHPIQDRMQLAVARYDG
jgi:serine-type D-Ala-D-Ala carboxypeptidase/endopeptidase (penicillin-binding protein 4)